MKYWVAIDIGASGGRHILGYLKDGKIITEEVYRFPNALKEKEGRLCWDVDEIFDHIIKGLARCKDIGKIPSSIGIDTWGVDFVLIDKAGKRIGDAVGYRDGRTKGMDEEVYKLISEVELYKKTGIQKQIFNTIYQLMAIKKNSPEYLKEAERLLMIPEYFNYLLTGKSVSEYTNATTTQLVNCETGEWDEEIIDKLGLPKRIFGKLHMPGTLVGELTKEVQERVGFNAKVVLVGSHDTASAVMAVPTKKEGAVYISSGTWSLMGTEITKADNSDESRQMNFTNEGGYDRRYRYLKNIMGLWMIQSVRKEIASDMDFGEICEKASKVDISSLVDCNDARFLAPKSMTEEIKKSCKESGQKVPEGIAETASVIYNSLAECYIRALREIEERRGEGYKGEIYVVGGGSKAEYLNELLAKKSGHIVKAGPTEATAIGNLLALMIADGAVAGLFEARKMIENSFEINIYLP